MFTSKLRPSEIIIDDSNGHLHSGAKNATEDGRGRVPRDWQRQPFGAHPFATAFPDSMLIPRNEWDARIEEMEAKKTRLSDLADLMGWKSLDQNGTNYCWCNGVVSAMNFLQSRDRLPGDFVNLSPASVAAQIKGYRNQGGWGGDALEWIINKGIYTIDQWPANYWQGSKYKTPEGDADALTRVVTEWWELDSRNLDQLATCLLLRIPVAVGFNWWSHEVCACDLVKIGSGTYGVRIRNSWSDSYGDHGYAVLSGSKMLPDDAVAPRVQSVVPH